MISFKFLVALCSLSDAEIFVCHLCLFFSVARGEFLVRNDDSLFPEGKPASQGLSSIWQSFVTMGAIIGKKTP